ncbi:hypothetical protein ASAP_3196 [Asaia bogorensis]|uniref:Uncharacterized protein n=1 Tax=Asaia bogorensis TaxID=91915 RepID=A0A060QM23_9PROT|nr:hypothetical protein ASAP_3196 [Asaia bogorensis]
MRFRTSIIQPKRKKRLSIPLGIERRFLRFATDRVLKALGRKLMVVSVHDRREPGPD